MQLEHRPAYDNGRPRIRPEIVALPEYYPFFTSDMKPDDVLVLVNDVVPKYLKEYDRQDICQDIVLAVLEGKLKIEDLAHSVTEFLNSHRKRFPSRYGPLSLEAPISYDDDRPLMDSIASAEPTPEEQLFMAESQR